MSGGTQALPQGATSVYRSLVGRDMFLGNRDAQSSTTANPGKHSPHELFYGVVPNLRMLPFLRLGYCRARRDSKPKPKAEMLLHERGQLSSGGLAEGDHVFRCDHVHARSDVGAPIRYVSVRAD